MGGERRASRHVDSNQPERQAVTSDSDISNHPLRRPTMKRLNRRHVLQHLAAATASIGLPALAQSDRRIVLGQSAAFSGPAAQLGIQMNRGAKLYFDSVNAAGGVNGAQIELRTMDDMYEPDKCKANTDAF